MSTSKLREAIIDGALCLLVGAVGAWQLGFVAGGGFEIQPFRQNLVLAMLTGVAGGLVLRGMALLWKAMRTLAAAPDITDWVRRSTRELEILAHEIAGTESGEEIEALARRGRELLGEAVPKEVALDE